MSTAQYGRNTHNVDVRSLAGQNPCRIPPHASRQEPGMVEKWGKRRRLGGPFFSIVARGDKQFSLGPFKLMRNGPKEKGPPYFASPSFHYPFVQHLPVSPASHSVPPFFFLSLFWILLFVCVSVLFPALSVSCFLTNVWIVPCRWPPPKNAPTEAPQILRLSSPFLGVRAEPIGCRILRRFGACIR